MNIAKICVALFMCTALAVTPLQTFAQSTSMTINSEVLSVTEWDGKTAMRQGQKYVLNKSIVISDVVTIPKGSTLTINKGAKLGIITDGKLSVRGKIAIKTGGVLSVSGTMMCYTSSFISDSGTIMLNKNGRITLNGRFTVNKQGKVTGKPQDIMLSNVSKVTIKGKNYCKKLALLLDESVSIPDLPIADGRDFDYLITKSGVAIEQYNGDLTSFKIPAEIDGKTVTSINSLMGNGITCIVIPASVKEIYDVAFSECSRLKTIRVEFENKYFTDIDGALYNKDKTMLLVCPQAKSGEYSIPMGVSEIADYALANCSELTNIMLPDGLVSIGELSFCDCGKISEITIPDSVEFIGQQAFDGCVNLRKVTLPQHTQISENVFPNSAQLVYMS